MLPSWGPSLESSCGLDYIEEAEDSCCAVLQVEYGKGKVVIASKHVLGPLGASSVSWPSEEGFASPRGQLGDLAVRAGNANPKRAQLGKMDTRISLILTPEIWGFSNFIFPIQM